MAEEAAGGPSASTGQQEGNAKKGKQKYRRDKPWDNEEIDHWKAVTISPEENPTGLLEESSFATLFPQYREQYLKQVWPDVKKILSEFHIKAELNLVEGSMTVKTTRKTWDPYMIIKARDLIKLLARSVPLPQAEKILEDDKFCDILKIGGLVRSKERFVKRRQRLVGPNGSTLKAIELLTQCYVLVQGQTVSIVGSVKGIKQVRRIVEDCFRNIHPIYHIKELMIRKELEKDPELKGTTWDRFLPHFKKRNVQRQKVKLKKKSKSVFPPQPQPRKEDLMMETGEYFLNEQERLQKKQIERRQNQKAKSAARKRERAKEFEPPASASTSGAVKKAKKRKEQEASAAPSTKELASKLRARAATGGKKKPKVAETLLL